MIVVCSARVPSCNCLLPLSAAAAAAAPRANRTNFSKQKETKPLI
ncbi:hypothetical protein [Methanimicrococcus hongohii]|nr:hypothetical protein [Methanimicrococcus sp. Hf6]